MSSRAAPRTRGARTAPASAVAETREGAAAETASSASSASSALPLPLPAVLARPRELPRGATGRGRGRGRRAPRGISERDELPQPVSPGAAAAPPPWRVAETARWRGAAAALASRGLASAASAEKGERLGGGADRHGRRCGRGRGERGGGSPCRLRGRGGELRRLVPIEGACRSAATATTASDGRDRRDRTASGTQRRLFPRGRDPVRVREGERVVQRRLVSRRASRSWAPRRGFQGEAGAPGPAHGGAAGDGVERGQRRAGEKQRLLLGKVAKIPAWTRPSRGAGSVEGNGVDGNLRRNSSRARRLSRLWRTKPPPVVTKPCPITLHYQILTDDNVIMREQT